MLGLNEIELKGIELHWIEHWTDVLAADAPQRARP